MEFNVDSSYGKGSYIQRNNSNPVIKANGTNQVQKTEQAQPTQQTQQATLKDVDYDYKTALGFYTTSQVSKSEDIKGAIDIALNTSFDGDRNKVISYTQNANPTNIATLAKENRQLEDRIFGLTTANNLTRVEKNDYAGQVFSELFA